MPILTTSRLTLRPWQITDLDDLFAYSHSPLVGPMAGWMPHETRNDARTALQAYITQEHHFAIVLTEENCVIGAVKLNPDENRGRYYAKSLSYVLSPSYWGKGYMTEAVRAVTAYAFDTLHVDLVSAFHVPENTASGGVLLRCGFACEGVLAGIGHRYDGSVCDMVIYSMDKAAYAADGI